MRAVGALDCNADGDFGDPSTTGPDGDRLVVYRFGYDTVNLLDGKYSALYPDIGPTYVETIGENLEWKIDIAMLPPGCRGSVNPIPILWATAQVVGFQKTTIDQAKQTYPWSNPMDYGDLPNPDPAAETCEQYPSRLPCNGPRHGLNSTTIILGTTIDPDTGGLYDVMASLDDATNTGAADDEDGVAPATAFAWTPAGGQLNVTISGVSGNGYLSCWIDWNNNQSFSDSGDKVIDDLLLSLDPFRIVSSAKRSFVVSISTTTTVDGIYNARCRISPSIGAATTGPIYGGEVEDYRWLPQTSALTIAQSTSAPAEALLAWTEVSTVDTFNIYRSSTPYQRPGGAPFANVADSPYSDAILGGVPDTYFYIMTRQRTVDGGTLESVASNEVGVIEFGLVPAD